MAQVTVIKFKKPYRLFHVDDQAISSAARAAELVTDGVCEIVTTKYIPSVSAPAQPAQAPPAPSSRKAVFSQPAATRTADIKN